MQRAAPQAVQRNFLLGAGLVGLAGADSYDIGSGLVNIAQLIMVDTFEPGKIWDFAEDSGST
ncbi:MAG: hypothetical protein LBT11_05665, partial [Treponema sp.]|nr:hypothetical protein [Treponema sp.]